MKYLLAPILIFCLCSCNNINKQSYFEDALKEYKKGDYDEALNLYNKEIELNPNNEDAYYERANCKFQLQDFYGALKDINKAIEIKEHPAFFSNRAAIQSSLGNYKDAISDSSIAIEKDPEYVFAYINRASAYSMLGNNLKAINDFTLVLELDPNNIQALLERGVAFQKIDEIESACNDWEILADKGVSIAESFFNNYCD